MVAPDNAALRQLAAEMGRTVRAAIQTWPQTVRLCVLVTVTAATIAWTVVIITAHGQ